MKELEDICLVSHAFKSNNKFLNKFVGGLLLNVG